MKLTTILLLMLIQVNTKAQKQKFVLIDSSTKEAIENATVFNLKSSKGIITNEDGMANLPISNDTLEISHVSYETIRIIVRNKPESDTLSLIPKIFNLKEVVVTHIDLKKKMQYVLDNLGKLYDISSKRFECTYKEKLKVNEKMARLSQVQLLWRNSNYNYDFDRDFEKQNQIYLASVDYSKILPNEIILSNGGYLKNSYFFELLFLSYYLNLIISNAANIKIESIGKSESTTKVIFSADIFSQRVKIASLKQSTVIFNTQNQAIIKFSPNFEYCTPFHKGYSRDKKIPYTSRTTSHLISLYFGEQKNNRLILSAFKSKLSAFVKYLGQEDFIEMDQNLYVTSVNRGKKIPKKKRVDLSDSLFENFPSIKKSKNIIALSKEELSFIND